ncbi:MAG: hypothetical protein A2W19_03010 [Spirochaetes bacterium RBG_16_49_21]|nr:MAG: hypothetical protein A2W19_03010 [Spirochaetes bacterium RBG_16_49_21]
MKSKYLLILSVILSFVFSSADIFAASMAETYGFSAEGIGRGNAMAATVSDWSSVWYNMAGLGRTRDLTGKPAPKFGDADLKLKKPEPGQDAGKEKIYPSQIAIGFMYTFPKLELNIQRFGQSGGSYVPLETNAAKIDPYGYISLGAAVDLNVLFKMPDFISSARLGVGLAINADGSMVKVYDVDPRTHDFLSYGREAQRAMILAGAGLGFLNDLMGAGVGVNLSFAGQGRVFLDAALTGNAQIPVGQSTMDLRFSPGALAGVYLSPGKLVSALDGLHIGGSYRMKTDLKIDPFDTAAAILGGIIQMNLLLAIYDYYSPNALTGGIAYSRWGVTLSYDITWEQWSEAGHSKMIKSNYIGIPKYRNVYAHKAGVKYDTPLSWLSVMMGYSYVPSYVPESATSALGLKLSGSNANQLIYGMYNFLDNDKHLASLGLKFTIPQMWRLGGQVVIILSYQYQYLVPRSATKLGNVSLLNDPTNWLPAYLLNPGYSYGGTNHSAIIEVGMRI